MSRVTRIASQRPRTFSSLPEPRIALLLLTGASTRARRIRWVRILAFASKLPAVRGLSEAPTVTTHTSDQKDDPSILAVLVLYQTSALQSPTLASLCQAVAQCGVERRFELLIYDNSASPSPLPAIPIPLTYLHDPANGGLVAAYNTALQLAQRGRNEWLLLLDQDTVLTGDYLNTL